MEITVRSINENDKEWVNDLVNKEWGSDLIVANNKIYKPADLYGLIAEEKNGKVGLITYVVELNKWIIITLNSLRPNKGIGTLLINELKRIAKEKGCKRIILETTNDNLKALKFYQKRGFQIIAVYPNAIDEARKIKPEIPLIGENGIPIRDALELELKLGI